MYPSWEQRIRSAVPWNGLTQLLPSSIYCMPHTRITSAQRSQELDMCLLNRCLTVASNRAENVDWPFHLLTQLTSWFRCTQKKYHVINNYEYDDSCHVVGNKMLQPRVITFRHAPHHFLDAPTSHLPGDQSASVISWFSFYLATISGVLPLISLKLTFHRECRKCPKNETIRGCVGKLQNSSRSKVFAIQFAALCFDVTYLTNLYSVLITGLIDMGLGFGK